MLRYTEIQERVGAVGLDRDDLEVNIHVPASLWRELEWRVSDHLHALGSA